MHEKERERLRLRERGREAVKGARLSQKAGQGQCKQWVDCVSLKSSFKYSFFQQSFEKLSVALKSVVCSGKYQN